MTTEEIKQPKGKKRKILFQVIKIAISALTIFLAIRMIDSQDLGKIIRETDILLFGSALGLYVFSQIISAERLRMFISKFRAGHHVTTAWNIKLYFIGMAYNLFLPGGVGGDAYKVLKINSRLKAGKSKVLAGVVLDRVIGLMVILLILSSIGFLFTNMFGQWYSRFWIFPTALVFFLIVRIIASEHQRFMPAIFPAVLLSILVQVLQIGSFLLLASATGMFFYAIPVAGAFLISSIATAIPVFMGGVGAREVVFATLATYLSFSPTEAVTAAILFSVITIISSLPGIALSWIKD